MNDAPGDDFFAPAEFDFSGNFQGSRDRQTCEVGDRHPVDFHGQALGTQALAVAGRTFGRGHEINQPVAIACGGRFFHAILQVADNASETSFAAFAGFPVKQQVLNFLRKFLKWSVEIDAVRGSRDLQHVLQILRTGTWPQATIQQRLGPVDDDLGGIEVILAAQAMAFGTSAIGAVEGKRTRLELRDVDAAIGTGEARGVQGLVASDHRNLHEPARQLHRQTH